MGNINNTNSLFNDEIFKRKYDQFQLVNQQKNSFGYIQVLQYPNDSNLYIQKSFIFDQNEQLQKLKKGMQLCLNNDGQHLIQVYNIKIEDKRYQCSQSSVFIIFDYFELTLHDLIVKNQIKDIFKYESEIWKFIFDIIYTLDYFIKQKDENIFINPEAIFQDVKTKKWKMIPCQFFDKDNISLAKIQQTHYCSPELFCQCKKNMNVGTKKSMNLKELYNKLQKNDEQTQPSHQYFVADISNDMMFSLGVIVLRLIFDNQWNDKEFYDRTHLEINQIYRENLLDQLQNTTYNYSELLSTVLRSMTNINVDQRMELSKFISIFQKHENDLRNPQFYNYQQILQEEELRQSQQIVSMFDQEQNGNFEDTQANQAGFKLNDNFLNDSHEIVFDSKFMEQDSFQEFNQFPIIQLRQTLISIFIYQIRYIINQFFVMDKNSILKIQDCTNIFLIKMPQNFVALQQQFIQRFEIKNVESLQLICKFKEDNKMSEIAICNDRDFEQLKQRHLKQSKKRNKNTGQNVLKIKTSVITKEEQFDENMSQETILKILSENIDIARKIKYDSDIQKKLNENLMPCRSCILQNDIERQIQQKSSNSLQKELDSNIFPTPSKCKVCSDKKFIKFSNTLRMVQHLTQEQLIFHFRNFYKCYSDYCKQVQKDKDRQKEECYAEEEDIWESEDGSSEEEIEKSENESYEEEDMDDEQDNESYEEEDSEDNLSSQDDASFSSITMKRSTKQKTKKLRQNDCRKTMKFYQKEEQYENQLEHIQMEQFNIENQFQQQETQQELIKKKQITTSHSPLFAWIYQNKQSKNAKYNAKDKKSFQFTMEKSRAEIKDNVIELKIVLYNNSEICWPNPIYLQGSEDNLYTNGVFIQLNENISSKKTRIISCKYDTNKLNDKLHQKDNQQVTQSKYSKKQYSQVDQCQEQQIDEDTKKLISFRFVNQQENFSTDYFTLQLKEKKKFNFFAICDFI